MSTEQITITIGRGAVGTDRLLTAERWAEFKNEIDRVLKRSWEIVVSSDGTGSWTDDEGRTYSEQNHVWIAIDSERSEADKKFRREIWRTPLERLADEFDQDAIALGWGTSELVERKREEAA